MGALISTSSSTRNMGLSPRLRHKRSVTSSEHDWRAFGLSEDLENWMKNLPPKLKATPIIHLAIPGEYNNYFVYMHISNILR